VPQSSTLLASVSLADKSQLSIRIVYPAGQPPLVEIEWPRMPTVTSLAGYDKVIAEVMRTLAVASVVLANRKAERKL
jgi:hypothetical protein